MAALPLDGVRVLDLSRLLPGPFCTLLLADMGADVIKVEDTAAGDYIRWMPPLVGDYSALYHALNRNKRAVSIDLKSARGRDLFLALAATADCVVESFRPGVLDRLGIGWETLHARNPRLVLCSISGYGQDGPYRDRAGHDLDYIALSGVLQTTGTADGTPVIPGVQIGDIGGGAQNAALAVCAALVGRERTGEGCSVDVSMLDGLISWLSIHAARHFAEDGPSGPARDVLTGRHPCYHLYRAADGWLAVGALEPKFWSEFCAAVGLPHLADAGLSDGEEASRVVAEVEGALAVHPVAEWMRRFEGRDVCVEPVLGLDSVFAHPQVVARGMLVPAGEAGPVAAPAHPMRYDGERPGVRRPAPRFGEHTAELLSEVGIDSAAYADLKEKGVVR